MNTILTTAAAAAIAFMAPATEPAEALHDVLANYLKGENGEIESLKRAFHPQGKLFFLSPVDGAFTVLDREAYIGFVNTTGSKNPKTMRVESADISGNAASAKVVLTGSTPAVTITDYLSLLRVDGVWMITSRISSIETGAH